jgi:hypothetical protein
MPYACWIVRGWAESAFAASAADSSAKYSSSPPGVTISSAVAGPPTDRKTCGRLRGRPSPKPVLAALYVQGPREDIEALVLAAVGVPGRPTVDHGLDHGEAAAGRLAGRLDVRLPAGHALTWSDDVSTGDALVGHGGLLEQLRRLTARYIGSQCRRAHLPKPQAACAA